MREFAKVSPQIWTSDLGRKIKNLGLEARVISLYLLTNPYAHMTGVYYIPVVLIAHEAGLSIEQTSSVLNNLCQIGYCSYDYEYEYVWVHDMGVDQVCAQLKANDNRIKAINTMYGSLPQLSFLQNFYDKYAGLFFLENCHDSITPLQAPPKPLRSNENKNENENEKDNENENNNERKNILSSKLDDADEDQIHSIKKLNEQTDEQSKKSSYHDQAKEILNFLNEKTKHRFRHDEHNLKLIIRKLKTGVTVDECRAVIARIYRDWHGTKMQKYIRPATLFEPTNFEQYLGICVVEDAVQNRVTEEGLKSEAR